MTKLNVRVLIALNISGGSYDAVVSEGADQTKHAQFPLGPRLARLGLIGTETIREAAGNAEADFQVVAQGVVDGMLEQGWEIGDLVTMRSKWNTGTQDWDIIDPITDVIHAWSLKYDDGSGGGAQTVILGTSGDHLSSTSLGSSLTAVPVIMVQSPIG